MDKHTDTSPGLSVASGVGRLMDGWYKMQESCCQRKVEWEMGVCIARGSEGVCMKVMWRSRKVNIQEGI